MSARRLAVALALAGAGVAALAQPYPMPPAPAAPRPLAIDAPTEARLDNGLRVIVARRPGVPLVTAELVVLSGSEADPPQQAGLAAFGAGLITQGTAKRSAPEVAAAAEALGGSLDAGAGWNQTTVSITVTTPKLDPALGLVAEVAREPAFAQAEIDRLRSQTLDGLKVAYADPGTVASLLGTRLAFGAGAYGHPAGGTPESLPRITRADLVAAHARAFRPDRAVLILAGEIDDATALRLARRHFASWAAPADAPPSPPRATGASDGPTVAVVDLPKAGQAGVVVDIALPDRDPREQAIGAVLNTVVGGGYSSRLNLEIRVKRGLSYGASSTIGPRLKAGLMQAAVQTKNESAVEVARLLDDELDRLMTTPVGADELAARKATLIGGISRSVETTNGLADAIRALVTVGRSPADLKTRIAAIEAVTADDVQRYATANLGRERRRLAIAGDAQAFGAALAAARAGLVTVPIGALDLERPGGIARP